MNRFVIVRLGALGDVVHAIPVAAALRRAFASARIDWVVSGKHHEVLDLVTAVDRVIVVRDRRDAGNGLSLIGLIRHLRSNRYDVAIDLQGLIKSAVIARLSGAPRVIGFSRAYARESLASRLYTDVHHPGGAGMYAPSETRHIVDVNLGVLGRLNVQPSPPEFPLRSAASPVADAIGTETGGRYALLNPGAAWPNKRWPPSRFGALAAALADRAGLRSVVLWGPGEREIGAEVVAQSSGAAVLSPETRIADIVALARGAAVMVSGDTGPTHLAAAVGTPIVGIYGPTRPERNGPWLHDDETVSRAGVCHCHHLRRCTAARWCLLDIEVAEVLACVERRLSSAAQHG